MILLLATVIGIFTGCTNIYSIHKHSAEMYSQVQDWILPSFLEENKIRGVGYKNPDYIENDYDNPFPAPEYIQDENAPKNRTFLIDNQETFDSIFKENTLSVDFDNEIVCLYIFCNCTPNTKYIIDEISVNNEKASICYKSKIRLFSPLDTTNPYPRCLIVKMDKSNISAVEFVEMKGSTI